MSKETMSKETMSKETMSKESEIGREELCEESDTSQTPSELQRIANLTISKENEISKEEEEDEEEVFKTPPKRTTVPFGADFDMLESIDSDPSKKTAELQPQDIDRLAGQVSKALERCCICEKGISKKERFANERMIGAVVVIDKGMTLQAGHNVNTGALLMLYRNSITTPANLACLLKMIDPSIRTGLVRCMAQSILSQLSNQTIIWDIKMKDLSFASAFSVAVAKGLDQDASTDQFLHSPICGCAYNSWTAIFMALSLAKDKPIKIIDAMVDFDWTAIFKGSEHITIKRDLFGDTTLFNCLHRLGVRVLQDHHDNGNAKKFLAKIGACQFLLCAVLRSVITGECAAKPMESLNPLAPARSSNANHLKEIANFLRCFFNCLTALPNNHETNVVVKLAHSTIPELVVSHYALLDITIPEHDHALHLINDALSYMEGT
jgi:hypothetical protein